MKIPVPPFSISRLLRKGSRPFIRTQICVRRHAQRGGTDCHRPGTKPNVGSNRGSGSRLNRRGEGGGHPSRPSQRRVRSPRCHQHPGRPHAGVPLRGRSEGRRMEFCSLGRTALCYRRFPRHRSLLGPDVCICLAPSVSPPHWPTTVSPVECLRDRGRG